MWRRMVLGGVLALAACASAGRPDGPEGDDDEVPPPGGDADAAVIPPPPSGADAEVEPVPEPDAATPGFTPDAAVPPPPPPQPDAGLTPGGVVYAHSASELYRVDPVTLEVQLVGPLLWPADIAVDWLTDLAVDADGDLVGISFTRVYDVDPATGVCTKLADLTGSFNGLSFVPAGVLDPGAETLVAAAVDGTLWRLEAATGVATAIGAYGAGLGSSGDTVSVAGFGTVATVKNGPSPTDWLATVDPATGAATLVGDTGVTDIWGLGYWGGQVYGFTATNQFVVIDVATGVATVVETGAVTWWGAGVTTAAPSSM